MINPAFAMQRMKKLEYVKVCDTYKYTIRIIQSILHVFVENRALYRDFSNVVQTARLRYVSAAFAKVA